MEKHKDIMKYSDKKCQMMGVKKIEGTGGTVSPRGQAAAPLGPDPSGPLFGKDTKFK